MGKNVAVFVDVANIFYAAKAAGVDIDYVTLLKAAVAGRDFVRAYAYTGLDPDNENQRNFHSFLARHAYKVVSKDIRKYGDGKVKANLDIELVVDMMKTARNLDVAIVVSGDGDFAPAIRAVQEMGVRVEVISFRGNTSSDLIEVADIFTDITQIARVEKGSRSGRRVADDDEDLSMTEVPDKLTEGSGRGRSRGRGRGRAVEQPLERVVASREGRAAEPRGGRGRQAAAAALAPAATTSTGSPAAAPGAAAGGLYVLPGEKLARAGRAAAPAGDQGLVAPEETVEELIEASGEGLEAGPAIDVDEAQGEEGDARRRRRRRGGRGRGRGRGREGQAEEGEVAADAALEDGGLPPLAPAAPRPSTFGSIWDSQLGMNVPATGLPASRLPALPEDEDFAEPEIPEYLLAERRRGGGGGGGGARGGRGVRGGRAGYAAAVDRERYGRGGLTGGVNRYPAPAPRQQPPRPVRQDRPLQQSRPERSGGRGNEPWSEVPPELEELLRAQLADKLGRLSRQAGTRPAPPPAAEGAVEPGAGAGTPSRRRGRGPGRLSDAAATETAGEIPAAPGAGAGAEASTGRGRRRRAVTGPEGATAPATETETGEAEAAPARRVTRRRTTTETPVAGSASVSREAAGETPKRRTTRRKTEAPGAEAAAPVTEAAAETPKRRTTRRKADPEPDGGAA